MPFGIGIWELAIVALVVLLLFGPARFPEIVRSLGRGARDIKRETQVFRDPIGTFLADDDEREEKRQRPDADA